METMGYQIVLTTCPQAQLARDIAVGLVERELAACVNIVAGIQSVYRWQGEVQQDEEYLLLIKSVSDKFDAIKTYLLAAHPYELPEIIAVPITDGLESYLNWLRQSTGAP